MRRKVKNKLRDTIRDTDKGYLILQKISVATWFRDTFLTIRKACISYDVSF
jgi:hypothetical protein